MWRDPLAYFESVIQTYGDVAQLDFGKNKALLINEPELIKYVLQDNNRNYRKSSTVKIVAQVLGKGLATNEGEFWRTQRRLMAPSFHRRQIEKLGGVMVDEALQVAARWQKTAVSHPIDLMAEMMNLTLNINVKTMFGAEIGDQAEAVGQAWTTILHTFNARSWAMVQVPDNWPSPANRRFKSALSLLDQTVYQFIQNKRHATHIGNDVLTMLLHAEDEETGAKMPDKQVRDEVMTIFLAGHETTSVLLAWTFYLLSQHSEVVAKLRTEIADVCNGRIPTIHHLPDLTYTRHVIDEVLRLYPPFWLIYRAPYEADQIGDYAISQEDMVFISPSLIHTHQAYWEEPHQFNPDRFVSDAVTEQPRYAYIPFGGGPRQCIGNNLALMEAQLVLASLVPKFDFEFTKTVAKESAVTLRPKGGVWLNVKPVH